MPVDDRRPEVIPSQVDPDVECVRADLQDPSGEVAVPPGGPTTTADGRPQLCPDGYVPRIRRRDYDLDGKQVVTHEPPEENPDAP